MKQFIEDFENYDSISCNICGNNYSNEQKAFIVKCSHSYCKKCLDDNIIKKKICSFCRQNYENELKENKDNLNKIFWENKIINNLIDLCQFLNMNVDTFLSFPLDFKYCENCEYFITNYSFNYHKSFRHTLSNFNKKLKTFFEENNITKKTNIIKDKNKFMYYLLYYYQSPFLAKFKFLDVKKTIPFNKGELKFYGESLRLNENNIFNNLIRINKSNIDGKWHKGVMINKKKGLIIHGYFCFKSKNLIELTLFPIIFGLFSYNNIKFFGFIKINKDEDIINNELTLEINDFIFQYGILYDNQKYYFGEFNEKNIINYFSDKKNNDDKDNIKNLINGEIINIKNDGVEIQRTIYREKVNGSILEIINLYTKENISIIPLNNNMDKNFEKIFLTECKINISIYNKTLIFNSKKNDSIIILDNFEGTIKNNSYFLKGYLITLEDNNTSLLDFKSFTLQNIKAQIDKNDYTFIDNLYQLFKVEIECIIEYCIFEIKGDLITKKKKLIEKPYKNLIIEQIFDGKLNNDFLDHKYNSVCCIII